MKRLGACNGLFELLNISQSTPYAPTFLKTSYLYTLSNLNIGVDMSKKIYGTRNCPECNKEITYGYKSTYNKAVEKNNSCKGCSQKGRRLSDTWYENMRNGHKNRLAKYESGELTPPNTGNTHTQDSRDKISKGNVGKVRSIEFKQKISKTCELKNPLPITITQINGLFIRTCLQCNCDIVYTNKNNAMYAERDERVCHKCSCYSETRTNNKKIHQQQLPLQTQYYNQVLSITKQQPIHLLENYDKRGRAGVPGAYQLDHKYSVNMGYKNNVDPSIIGDISNLEFITWEDNLKKSSKCSITLNELKENI